MGEGFEPSKSMTADLQSAPFGRSGTPPGVKSHCRLFSKMNGGGGRITRRYLSSPFGPLPAATFSRWRSSRTLVEGSYPSPGGIWAIHEEVVVGEGFEPSKSMTADLVKSHCRLFSKMNGGGGKDNSSLSLLANIVYACRGNHITVVNNGGGGRIRTFEVDDGRFTVCSLWPLGNPTTG